MAVGLTAPGRKHDLGRPSAENFRHAASRVVEQGPRTLSFGVCARRIPPCLLEAREHRLDHPWVNWGRGGVVEVDAAGSRHTTSSPRGAGPTRAASTAM